MKRTALALCLACTAVAGTAHADDVWTIKVGAHVVDPKSNNGTLAAGALLTDVGSDVKPTFQLEYFLNPNLGIEALAALPFQHTVKLNGADAARVKHLPPTISVQWHFRPGATVNPFVGLGLNYTRFFSIDERGPLAGKHLKLADSWGPAVHAGIDVPLNERWLFSADVRWMDIDTQAKVNGAKVGTVHIDPIAYGVAVGYRF